MRLWELEEGDDGNRDGADANAMFGGVRAAEQAAMFAAMIEEEARAEPEPPPPAAAAVPQPPAPEPPQQARARQAPNPPRAAQQRRQPVVPDPGLQRFLQLAANDEEDGWDSDEMEDFLEWDVGAAAGDRERARDRNRGRY